MEVLIATLLVLFSWTVLLRECRLKADYDKMHQFIKEDPGFVKIAIQYVDATSSGSILSPSGSILLSPSEEDIISAILILRTRMIENGGEDPFYRMDA